MAAPTAEVPCQEPVQPRRYDPFPDDAGASDELDGSEHSRIGGTVFGPKSIGFFGGIALMVNNITGPGVVQLAPMFVQSGWLAPTAAILGLWCVSSLGASMFAEVMRNVPGNDHFQDRIEYSTTTKWFLGHRVYYMSVLSLCASLQALNILSIQQSTNNLDRIISTIFGQSCGLQVFFFVAA